MADKLYNEKTAIKRITVFLTFALVPLLVFIMVMLIPFLYGLFATFTDWSGTQENIRFVGFQNYIQAFTDPLLWDSMWLTLKYVFSVLILTNALALILALLVTSGFKGQNGFRAAFFTPNLIGGVILGFIWMFIFSRVFVYWGKALDIQLLAASWLGDSKRALWALIIVSVWQLSGYMMLIYIAGFTSVPDSVIEAARIDGAKNWQVLTKIRLPLMMPAFTISLFLTLQRSFMTYEINLTLTKGAPYRSTELVAMHIYNEAFKLRNFGAGQAKAFLLFVIVATIAIIQVVALKRKEVDAL